MDIFLSWKAWGSLKFSQILRYLLKFAIAAMWAIVLPIGYTSYVQNRAGLVNFLTSWAADIRNRSFFKFSIAIYLAPNIFSALLFFFPPIRKYVERSNSRIIRLIMWWAQASILYNTDSFVVLYYHLPSRNIYFAAMLIFINVLVQPKLFIGRGMHEDTFTLLK